MKFTRAFIAAVIGAGTLVEFLLWGGDGIGFTLLFLILLAAYYIACGTPKGSRRHILEHAALAVMIAGLALSYTFLGNEPLRIINFPALVFLMGLLFLHGTIGEQLAWDQPLFALEVLAGYFVRPFICLGKPWSEFAQIRKDRRAGKTDPAQAAAGRRILLQIGLAVLVSVPLLLVLAVLLASSDAVFGNLLAPIVDAFQKIQLSTLAGKIIVGAVLLPFTASAVWSYRDRVMCTGKNAAAGTGAASGADTKRDAGTAETKEKFRFVPPAFSITILVLVNLLYLLYAGVQFIYLFGAWNGNLPDGLTYAEYARNGFFELAFVSFINAAMLLCSIRLTRREGKAGLVVRCLSILLLLLAGVQMVSAFLRMNLYIRAYGLTQLRYFVIAFMILMALNFIFLLLREFLPAFPLFRSMVLAGAAALFILNYSMPDARIAQYNVDHYLSGELSSLDIEYIRNDLSADAQVILYRNADAITKKDANLGIHVPDSSDLRSRYEAYKDQSWKNFNLSQERLAVYQG